MSDKNRYEVEFTKVYEDGHKSVGKTTVSAEEKASAMRDVKMKGENQPFVEKIIIGAVKEIFRAIKNR